MFLKEAILEEKPVEPCGESGEDEEGPTFTPFLTHTDRAGPWQSESLLASSWSTVSDADLGDIHSLGSSSAAQAAEENHFSIYEPELLEKEEVGGFGAETGLWKSDGLKTELNELIGATDEDIQPPQTHELLVSAEEPHTETEQIEFMQVVPPMALPPLPILKLDPPSNISTPVLPTDTEELPSTQGLQPPSILDPVNAPTVNRAAAEKHSAQASSERDHSESKPDKNENSSDLPVLFCGGAALIAVIGILTYGAVAFCRK